MISFCRERTCPSLLLLPNGVVTSCVMVLFCHFSPARSLFRWVTSRNLSRIHSNIEWMLSVMGLTKSQLLNFYTTYTNTTYTIEHVRNRIRHVILKAKIKIVLNKLHSYLIQFTYLFHIHYTQCVFSTLIVQLFSIHTYVYMQGLVSTYAYVLAASERYFVWISNL